MWELAQIRSMDLQQKLFVLTKPKLSRRNKGVAWDAFASALLQAGYQSCGEDPGPGAAVGFDGGGEAVVLQRDARSAAETVDALSLSLRPTLTA